MHSADDFMAQAVLASKSSRDPRTQVEGRTYLIINLISDISLSTITMFYLWLVAVSYSPCQTAMEFLLGADTPLPLLPWPLPCQQPSPLYIQGAGSPQHCGPVGPLLRFTFEDHSLVESTSE